MPTTRSATTSAPSSDLTQAIRLNPRSTLTIYNRAMAYRAKGEPDRAVPDFDAVLKINAERRVRLSQPRPRLSRHARLRPRHPGLRPGDQDQPEPDRGAQRPRPRLRLQGRDRSRHRGLRPGDPARSEDRWPSTTAASPIATRARPTRAINNYDQAILINSDFALAYYNRGNAYYDKRDYDRAIQTTTRRSRSIRTTRWPTTIAASSITTATSTTGGGRPEQGDRARSEGCAGLLQPRPDLSRHGRDGQGAGGLRPVDQARSEEPAAVSTTAASPSRDKGDQERAIADFSQSIRLDARNALAFYNRGLAYWDRREFDTALADYEQAIRINPGYAPTYYNRGLAYYEQRDYDRAIHDLNQAINGRPNYPLAFNIRGLAYNAKGETDRAHPGLRPGDPARCQIRRRLQQPRRSLSGQARSRPRHRRLRSGDQGQPELRHGLLQPRRGASRQARLRARGGGLLGRRSSSIRRTRRRTTTVASPTGIRATTTSAIADFEQAIKLDPKFAAAYANRGTAYYDKRDYDRAIADFDQAIQLNPNSPSALSRSRPRLSRQGRQRRAPSPTSIRRSSSTRKFAAAFASRGLAYSNRQRLQPRHRRSRQRDPARSASSPAPTTIAVWSMRRPARSIAPLPTSPRRSSSTRTTTSPTTTAAWSIAARAMLDRAIEDFDQAIKVNPKYDVAYNNRGLTYKAQGRRRARHRRLRRRPSRPIRTTRSAYNNRGLMYRGKGDLDNAIKDFDAAIKINPNDPQSLYNRGSLLAEKRTTTAPSPISTSRSSSTRTRRWPSTTAAARTRAKGRARPRHRRLRSGDQAQSRTTTSPTTIAASAYRMQGRQRARHRRLRPRASDQSELRVGVPRPRHRALTTAATTTAPSPT